MVSATHREASGPLRGLQILDISTIIAAPFVSTLMSDYGAEVVKVELPGTGDGLRSFPPQKAGTSLWWKSANRNKRFVTIDLRKPAGRDLLLAMLPEFDVLVENFRPGTLSRWGLDTDVLWAARPELVILRVTGFGQTGPYRSRPGFAKVFEAMAGFTTTTGEADSAPMGAGYPIADPIGGLFGAVAVLSALLGMARGTIEPGEEIDLSLTEAMFRILDSQTMGYDQLGEVPGRSGNQSYYSAPSNLFATSDGRYVFLAGSTHAIFGANATAIGQPELADDPRFCDNVTRIENRAAIDRYFADWFGDHTAQEAVEAFAAAGGTLAPIYSIDQIYADPHFAAREAIISVPDDDFGSAKVSNVVPRFTRNPGNVRHTARALGADNAAVFAELLNLDEAALGRLVQDGVI